MAPPAGISEVLFLFFSFFCGGKRADGPVLEPRADRDAAQGRRQWRVDNVGRDVLSLLPNVPKHQRTSCKCYNTYPLCSLFVEKPDDKARNGAAWCGTFWVDGQHRHAPGDARIKAPDDAATW
ncbi:hypothetical protein C8F04DRAFT_1182906 [Mycena alexandri]|uniref:Uncharacterized protein n=1 Tax=Mycena alexandri TaxID=1745969 RepID=A0AAD6SVN5_9AGAR|nr:hypothetical protein C8F04DRAFT_1182906 [Mycena alexandri]